MKKIKKQKFSIENLILLIVFIISTGFVIGNIVYIFVNLFKSISFTPFGCIIFAIALIIAEGLYGYLFEDDDK